MSFVILVDVSDQCRNLLALLVYLRRQHPLHCHLHPWDQRKDAGTDWGHFQRHFWSVRLNWRTRGWKWTFFSPRLRSWLKRVTVSLIRSRFDVTLQTPAFSICVKTAVWSALMKISLYFSVRYRVFQLCCPSQVSALTHLWAHWKTGRFVGLNEPLKLSSKSTLAPEMFLLYC